jgi:hypothetical protein
MQDRNAKTVFAPSAPPREVEGRTWRPRRATARPFLSSKMKERKIHMKQKEFP